MKQLKLIGIIIVLCIVNNNIYAQDSKYKVFLDLFNKKCETVFWLCEYDKIAWISSDMVLNEPREDLEKLGREWFCFQTDKDEKWHAIYGKLENKSFDLVFHYEQSGKKLKKSSDKLEDIDLAGYAKSINLAYKHFEASPLNIVMPIRYNHYVKKIDNKLFKVWIFPAFQPNNHAIYGGEYIYLINIENEQILEDNSYYIGEYRGFLVQENKTDIEITYNELEEASLGGIFFYYYYEKYFNSITIKTKNYISTIKDGYWFHVEREENNETEE
jgi:hypothetical protein